MGPEVGILVGVPRPLRPVLATCVGRLWRSVVWIGLDLDGDLLGHLNALGKGQVLRLLFLGERPEPASAVLAKWLQAVRDS